MKDLAPPQKFSDPLITAKGEARAHVALERLETLWINTGTLCNITCANCYIDSSPTNDALVYFTLEDLRGYLAEIERDALPVREIGFTGGEPFMNPAMVDMARAALDAGHEVLILTNAMRPMMRKSVKAGLLKLNASYPGKMTLRISVDHWNQAQHDTERGKGSFARTLEGMDWLAENGFAMTVAGRTVWGETDAEAREGYAALFAACGYPIDASNPGQCVLFPEMDESVDVPEITNECWGILNKSPSQVMCSNARMVVRRRGADAPAVLACTLLAYHAEFEMGETLADAARPVSLNHPHCAKFCVLGGASCSG